MLSNKISFVTSAFPLLFTVLCMINLTSGTKYTLADDFTSSPSNFFSSFSFFTAADPTNGFVSYLDYPTATAYGLLGYVDPTPISTNTSITDSATYGTTPATSIYIGVDSTNVINSSFALGGRPSVRLTSNKVYNKGMLLIADIAHMPTGCGTWPALWMTGGDWPNNGEIDIIEGVNLQAENAMTLHTNAGCVVENTTDVDDGKHLFEGLMVTENCDVNAQGQSQNQGCSITAPVASYSTEVSSSASNSSMAVGTSGANGTMPATFGAEFNAQGGGVYVMEWKGDGSGFRVWFFPRYAIPAILTNSVQHQTSESKSTTPTYITTTSAFGTPLAQFTGTGCDFTAHFQNMQIVLNTALCGAWAGDQGVWNDASANGAESCAVRTGYKTCEEFVAAEPEAFEEAFWEVRALRVYVS